MTNYEKEVQKELKKAKRRVMADAFYEGMTLDYGKAMMYNPLKTMAPIVGVSFGIGIAEVILKTTKDIIIPKPIQYGINAALSIALPVAYGIKNSMEVGNKFDKMTTLRA